MFEQKIRVLIVDDMKFMRSLVAKLCTQIGLTDITFAEDGLAAWELIEKASPPFDLILSDWNMPKLSGIELLKLVREHSTTSKTKFLLITAEGEPHQIEESRKLNVNGHIVKPFTKEILADTLKTIFNLPKA